MGSLGVYSTQESGDLKKIEFRIGGGGPRYSELGGQHFLRADLF